MNRVANKKPARAGFSDPMKGSLFSVREHAEETGALNSVLDHLLVLQAQARVIPLADVTEVVDVRLQCGVILVVHVLDSGAIEGANLLLNALRFHLLTE